MQLRVGYYKIETILGKKSRKSINFTIENHASVFLAEALSFFQGHLYVDLKYASPHKYCALVLYHKIRMMSRTPSLRTLACISYKDHDPVQG